MLTNESCDSFDFKVTIKPTLKCNHQCWYCEEYDNSNHTRLEDMTSIIEHLKLLNKNNIWIYFYGGEPTINPYWEQLVLDCDIIASNIQTQSNLSLKLQRLEKFCDTNYRSKVTISPSYHISKQPIKEFIYKCSLLEQAGMLAPIFVSTEIKRAEQFKKDFQALYDKFGDKVKVRYTEYGNDITMEYNYFSPNYSDKEEEYTFLLDNQSISYYNVRKNRIFEQFKYKRCESGSKHLVINPDGTLYNCNDYYEAGILLPYNILSDWNPNKFKSLFVDNICRVDTCVDGLEYVKYTNINP